MADDFTTLETIFQMMEPSDLHGAKKIALGKKVSDVNVIKQLLDILYNAGASGAMTISDIVSNIDDVLKKTEDSEAKSTFKEVFHLFSSDGKQPEVKDDEKNKAIKKNGTDPINNVSFQEIVGTLGDLAGTEKTMGIFQLTSPFLSPALRNAERCEIFLNSIPSVHASRMVPLLDVEFAFHRLVDPKIAGTMFGQIRFLMGGDKQEIDKNSPTGQIVAATTSIDAKRNIETTTMGMEMFTSPQTLVNPSQVSRMGRYTDVIDPFRPFASIESLTVNVLTTVGFGSQKKATLIIKLHDRSRMSELADLVRPQIYQNGTTAPTVWITYGWRYPYEPGNSGAPAGSQSYSDFINNNMLVREAYAIANSSFAFDNVGQVTITLELWTKGVAEMRRVRISETSDGMKGMRDKIEAAAHRIAEIAGALGMNVNGSSRDIRAYQIIDAAERGQAPDLSSAEIKDAIAALEASFKKGTFDKPAAEKLIKELKDFYSSKDKKNLDLKESAKQQATKVAQQKFEEVLVGADPFLPSDGRNSKDNPELVKTVNEYNKQLGTAKVEGFRKQLCSFGKLCSVFIASAFKSNDSIDELQLFFHQFNNHAGTAAGLNIAQFPIEMPVFFDQYKAYVEQRRTESMTLEEFLKLCVDAQLSDERNLAYGFKTFFKPYKSGTGPTLADGEANKTAYENALSGVGNKTGPFIKPQVEMYIETTFATDGKGKDLLKRFELQQSGAESEDAKAGHLKRIMRIHIFDKAHNPYETQSLILRSDNDPALYIDVEGGVKKEKRIDLDGVAKAVDNNGSFINFENGRFSLDPQAIDSFSAIKQRVSKTMPSIIYGSNATMVINANLASKMDQLMATSQMQMVAAKSGPPQVGQPNGSGAGGLPLRIIPASMTMTTLGCPTIDYGQIFFVDFNTGTSADNVYVITGLNHTFAPGKFETQITFTFVDGYARYEGAQTMTKFISTLKLPETKK